MIKQLTRVFSLKRGGMPFRLKLLLLFFFLPALGLSLVYGLYLFFLIQQLPSVESLKNYHPPLISTVLDRHGQKAGEFFKERRLLTPYEEFPPHLVQAFVSAEDGRFFHHKGLNIKAIFRAFLANLKAGRKVQGGSTITQQVARSLLLSSEKTYRRKLKEAVLARRMEKNLSKQEILYLYLNQIYLGHGAYGVGMAAEIYFRKKVRDLNLAECSLLAGLPQAPSRFSPIYNPQKAKERQNYVLQRMVEEAYIDSALASQTSGTPLKVFLRGKYHEKAPYYLETLRQSLLTKIDEQQLLTGGLTIKTAMDLSLQELARQKLKEGLRALDKRQGFRGPLANLKEEEAITAFFEKQEKEMMDDRRQFRWILPTYKNQEQKAGEGSLSKKDNASDNASSAEKSHIALPPAVREEGHLRGVRVGEIQKALVKKVDDEKNQALLKLAFGGRGVLPLENMKWARAPDPKIHPRFAEINRPSQALKVGDVVFVKVEKPIEDSEADTGTDLDTDKDTGVDPLPEIENPPNNIFLLSLEQEPLVEGALIAFDQQTGEITALVGGYDFHRSQFNRAYQAARQTGSVFKPLVYLAALDKDFTPATLITDAPVVYEEEEAEGKSKGGSENELSSIDKTPEKIKEKQTIKEKGAGENTQAGAEELEEELAEEEQKTWKPDNYGRRFSGDILFRNALIRSMNVPTVKVIEKVGIEWVSEYARRLGVFSPLNPDYTLALGSSSVTLYEMTKVFSILGRAGRRIDPLLVQEVRDSLGGELLGALSLEERFAEQTQAWNETMEQKRQEFLDRMEKPGDSQDEKKTPLFFFSDPEQLISEKTAFIMTTLLSAVVKEPQGTGFSAREMDWPIAGKTGTTNGYYDAWFIGYSPQMVVGVWVGFDDEKTLGRGETGARAGLPIWLSFMQEAHKGLEKEDFPVPEGIVFTNIDNETGTLVTPSTREVVRQAFREGAGPAQGLVEEQAPPAGAQEDQDFLREDFSQ